MSFANIGAAASAGLGSFPSAIVHPGSDVTVPTLRFDGALIDAEVSGALTAADMVRTMDGASTVTLTLRDSDKRLLNRGALAARTKLQLDGLLFELVGVAKSGFDLTVTFEDLAVARLRSHDSPKKVAPGTTTRIEFARMLLAEEPWIKLVTPPIHMDDAKVELARGGTGAKGTTGGKPSPEDIWRFTAAVNAGNNAAAGADPGPVSGDENAIIAAALVAIRTVESGGKYTAQNPHGSASGAYQFINSTWGGYGGYQRAKDAPPSVQDARARIDVLKFYRRYNHVIEAIPASWYTGGFRGFGQLNYVPRGNTLTVQQYVDQWMPIFRLQGSGSKFGGGSFGTGGTTTPKPASKVDTALGNTGGTTDTAAADAEPENTWDCLGRIFEEIGWRRYMRNGVLIIAPDTFALLGAPTATIREYEAGVDGIDFAVDAGQPVQTCTVTARSDRWSYPPGTLIAVDGMGPANGRYLIMSMERSLFSPSTTITLQRPQPTIPEPVGDPVATPESQKTSGSQTSGSQKTAVSQKTSSGILGTAALRLEYAPACTGPWTTLGLFGDGSIIVRDVAADAFRALSSVLEQHRYRTRRGDTGAYNCLAGETRVITRNGWIPISEAVGVQEILTAEMGHGGPGRWVEAEIRGFGEQELWEIVLERYGVHKIVHATADHRWLARTESGPLSEVATADLIARDGRAGHRLASVKPQSVASRTTPSPIGIAAGIVFGDGTLDEQGARAMLCGDKDAELDQWFHPAHTRLRYDDMTVIRGLPRSWKSTVPLDEGPGVLYGWLAGYFAADGRVSEEGTCELNSADLWRLEVARTAALRLGIASSPITHVKREGYGDEPTLLHSLRLDPRSLDSSFFLIGSHRERWNGQPRKQPPAWSVKSVTRTERVEEVFCAIVEGTETFAIEDFILTGNCRRITGGTGYSLHAYGIACDINWNSNPYGPVLVTDMPAAMVGAAKAIRTKSGRQVFGWGGDYRNNKDAMHFEIVCSRTDLLSGIDPLAGRGSQFGGGSFGTGGTTR